MTKKTIAKKKIKISMIILKQTKMNYMLTTMLIIMSKMKMMIIYVA